MKSSQKSRSRNEKFEHGYEKQEQQYFGEKHKVMLGNVKKWMDMGRITIDPDVYPELMTDMRIATADEDMSLQKTEYTTDLIRLD
jgi:hypothetical protein